MRRPLPLPALLASMLAGCVSLPGTKPDARDPWEHYNRWMFRVNDAVDRGAVKPVAKAYVRVVPQPVRTGVSNFFGNIAYPRTIINDFLQGKLADGARDSARLVVNTVVGLGGVLDPAQHMGLDRHDEDFGQTLGHWGVPPGPYLVIPVLGPSDFRDAPAKLVDTYATPYNYLKSSNGRYGLYVLTQFDRRVELLAADSALRNAFDPYVFVRNAYVARRNYLVHDGDVPEDNFDDSISALPEAPAGTATDGGAASPQAPTATRADLPEPAPAVPPPTVEPPTAAAAETPASGASIDP